MTPSTHLFVPVEFPAATDRHPNRMLKFTCIKVRDGAIIALQQGIGNKSVAKRWFATRRIVYRLRERIVEVPVSP